MKVSLAASFGLHASILIAALVVLPNPNPYNIKPQEAVLVDISRIGDDVKKMALATDAPEKIEKPTPKKAEQVKQADPTAKIAEEEKKQAKEAKAEPAEDELKDLIKDTVAEQEEADALAAKKKAEDKKKAEEKKKAEDKKKAAEKKKAEEKKKKAEEKKKQEKLDVAKLEALLNKENEEKTTDSSEAIEDGNPSQGEVNLQGKDAELVGTIVDALVSRVKQCWTVPPGARDAGLVIRIRFSLNADGSLNGNPAVENYQADPLFDATARSAVAALIECQSYSFLPAERYDLWKDNMLDFDTKQMFQG